MGKNKVKITFTAIILSAVVLLFVGKGWNGKDSKETVKEIRPVFGSIQRSITSTGTVQPQNRIEMKPPISGRVDKILVEEGQQVRSGDVLALMSSTDRAALLDAARTQGDKSVSYWEDVYKPTPIIAPIDGEVIVRAVQPGQTITASDPVVVLSDRLIVQAQVDETDIGKVKEKQKATISLDAYPDIRVDASVAHVYYESKTVNNVTIYQVDILPEKVPDVFRSGMTANVRIIQESRDRALLVPLEAVQRGKERDFVFVRDENKKTQKREIKLGILDEANVEIISGIDENDIVVIRAKKYSPSQKSKTGTNPFMPSGGGRR